EIFSSLIRLPRLLRDCQVPLKMQRRLTATLKDLLAAKSSARPTDKFASTDAPWQIGLGT
ncbi:hypothetical protein LPJ71_004077, partial [Coemansia sp. S17]